MTKPTKATRHKKAMEKQKAKVDATIASATLERGVAVLLTGDGKGKTSFRIWHGDARSGLWPKGGRCAIY